MPPRPPLSALIAELRRRRVFRALSIYGVAAWLVIQVATSTFPYLGLPGWSVTLVIVLGLLGFIPVFALAWAYDLPSDGPEGLAPPLYAPERVAVRAGRFPVLVTAVALIGLLAGAALFWPSRGETTLIRERVVVAPFENLTGDPALEHLGRMAADWITQGVSQSGLAEVVSTSALLALGLADDAGEAGGGTARLRALALRTGAGTVIGGTYYRTGDSLQIQAQIFDAIQGRVLLSPEPVSGAAASPLEPVNRLRGIVLGSLGSLLSPRFNQWSGAAGRPPTYEAYKEYLTGLDFYNRLEYEKALHHYRQAYAADSSYLVPLLHSMHGYAHLGRWAVLDSVAEHAELRRARMTAFEHAFLDGVQAYRRGDLRGAHSAYRRLAELVPGTEWAFQHGSEALKLNRPTEAAEVLGRIDAERNGFRHWRGYWAAVTAASHLLGRHAEELALAERGRALNPDDPWHVGFAVRALIAEKRLDDAMRRLDELEQFPSGPRGSPGAVMRMLGLELHAHEHPKEAALVVERALAWYRNQPGEERATVAHRYGMAQVLYDAGALDSAKHYFTELVKAPTLVSGWYGYQSVDVRGYLGVIAALQGDGGEAQRIAQSLEQLQQPYLLGQHTAWRARIAAAGGDAQLALELLRAANAQGAPFTIAAHVDPAFRRIRKHAGFREYLRPKG